jgi:hypothetical protein
VAPLLRPHSINKDNKIDPNIETQTRSAHIRVWITYPGETLSLACLPTWISATGRKFGVAYDNLPSLALPRCDIATARKMRGGSASICATGVSPMSKMGIIGIRGPYAHRPMT